MIVDGEIKVKIMLAEEKSLLRQLMTVSAFH